MDDTAGDDQPHRAFGGADSRFVELLGIDVHHVVAGPEDAPAVLFHHHFYGHTGSWRHVMAALAEDHRVIALDRPGFGLTERKLRRTWNGTNPYTRATAVRVTLALLDHLGIDEVALVGSSAGGTTVLETYAQAPERVRALALLAPAITGDVGPPPRLRPLLRTRLLRRLAQPIAERAAADITPARIGRSWFDPTKATEEDAALYRRALSVPGWEHGLWDVMTAEAPPRLAPLLGRIEVPTIVVSGDTDRVVRPGASRRTAAAIPGARFVLLEDCGHVPHEECPDRLVEVLRPFLATPPA